jgi:RNA polymerase sigma factor (sigma-70 family)
MAGAFLSWQTMTSAKAETIATDRGAGLSRSELETLYLIRRPEMIRFLIRFGVDVVEAEDITQEVFLDAFDESKTRKRPDNHFRWALVCARNLAIDRYHRTKKETLASQELWKYWEETLVDEREGLEARVYRTQRQMRLIDAISKLSPIEQQCLVLRSEGVTFREIAKSLCISMQDAVYATDVAIQKLQRRLQSVTR